MQKNRVLYIDNIRIYLTVIVILHHLAITYGAPGGWYYREFEFSQLEPLTLAFLVFFAAGNQAYFMGFFFFLGGYFSSLSLKRKSTSTFVLQRFSRLGIPLLLFVALISPITRLSINHLLFGQEFSLNSFARIYGGLRFGTELGPMWFILLLLIFSVCFALVIPAFPEFNLNYMPRISSKALIVFALLIGCVTYLVRIWLPIGTVFQPLNLQIPFLPQYIVLYVLGTTAARLDWLVKIERVQPGAWLIALVCLILVMPVIFIFSGGLNGDVSPALGGLSWQSLAFSVWEQLFCVCMIVILLWAFRKYFNHQQPTAKELSSSAYAAYIIHTPVLVTLSVAAQDISAHPLVKIALGAVPVLGLSFLAASILRRLPLLKRVL